MNGELTGSISWTNINTQDITDRLRENSNSNRNQCRGEAAAQTEIKMTQLFCNNLTVTSGNRAYSNQEGHTLYLSYQPFPSKEIIFNSIKNKPVVKGM